jgi:DNA-binding transcriptional LysR family regulator
VPPQGLDQHPVVWTPWSLVTAFDDPLGSRQPLRLEDVNTRRLISGTAHIPGASTNQIIDSAFAAEGVTLGPRSRIAGWDTQLLMVEAGLGHAVVPNLWLHGNAAHLSARSLPQIRPLTFGWVSRRWSSLPPAAHDYARRLQAHLAGLASSTGVDVFPPIPS